MSHPIPDTPATLKQLLAAAAALTLAGPVAAQPDATPEPVVAVVRVAKPWYAPRGVVASRMRGTLDQYARLPGLAFKAYSLEQSSGDYGGIYFWRDRASAEAWFNEAWHARVRQERGVDGKVTLLAAPVSIDNVPGGTALDKDSGAVATVVAIPIPPGVSRERLVQEFRAAVPQYQKIPGLLRKHFVIGADASFGGVYLWKDEASARAWFSPAWTERVRATYRAEPRIEWYDTPILLPTAEPSNAIGGDRLSGPAR